MPYISQFVLICDLFFPIEFYVTFCVKNILYLLAILTTILSNLSLNFVKFGFPRKAKISKIPLSFAKIYFAQTIQIGNNKLILILKISCVFFKCFFLLFEDLGSKTVLFFTKNDLAFVHLCYLFFCYFGYQRYHLSLFLSFCWFSYLLKNKYCTYVDFCRYY